MYFFITSLNSSLSPIIKFNNSTSSSFFPSKRRTHILLSLSSLWIWKSFFVRFSFIHSLYMFPSTVCKKPIQFSHPGITRESIGRAQENLDEINKKNMPYKENDNEIQFKVKLNSNTKIVDSNKNPIKIDLRQVPCVHLRDYKDAIIDIVITGESKEFKRRTT